MSSLPNYQCSTSELEPYRPPRRSYNNSTTTSAIITETQSSYSHSAQCDAAGTVADAAPIVPQDSNPQQNRKSFFLLIRQITRANVELHISTESAAELSGFPSQPMEFIGRGRSFYLRSHQYRQQALGSVSELVIRKLPLIEYDIHGNPKDTANEERLQAVLLELLALTHEPLYKHPNIVDYLGVCWEPEVTDFTLLDKVPQSGIPVPVLLLEHARLGSLDEFMTTTMYQTSPMSSKAQLCRDVAEGLFALHSCGIVHGDIKPGNILIFDSKDGNGYTAKLADFGFSVSQARNKDFHSDSEIWKLRGRTWPWNDPECHLYRTWPQLQKSDVFSYGLLIWSVLSGKAIENLFDLDRKLDDLHNPTLRQWVEDLKRDGSLGNNATTFFRNLNPMFQLLVRCLFEFSLHPTVSIRGSMESICNIWNLWFNDTRDWPKSKFWHIGQTDIERVHLQRIMRHISPLPIAIKQQFTTIGLYSWLNQLESLTFRAFCHLIGWFTDKDVAQAMHLIREASNISPSAAPFQAMFLDNAQPEGRSFVMGMNGTTPNYALLPPPPKVPEFLYQMRCRQWRKFQYGLFKKPREMEAVAHSSGMELYQVHLQDILENHLTPKVVEISHNKLHFAICSGFTEALQTILASPEFDPTLLDQRDYHGDTPFLIACRFGAFRAATLLVDAGSDVTVRNEYGETALHFLCDFEHKHETEEIVRIVLAHGGTALLNTHASSSYPREAIHVIPTMLGPPLNRAIIRNNLAVAEVLLHHGANPLALEQDGKAFISPMALAAVTHSVEMLKLFVKHVPGGNLARYLRYAIRGTFGFQRMYIHGPKYIDNLKRTFDFLLEHIPPGPVLIDIVGAQNVPIIVAIVQFGDLDMLEYLLERLGTTDINAYYEGRLTALHMAICIGSLPKFKLLLHNGADANAVLHFTSDSWTTTLSYCCSSLGGTLEMAKELLQRREHRMQGVQNSLRDFTIAVLSCKFDVAQLLLEAAIDDDGVNMEETCERGWTVIGEVVRVCSVRSVSMLRFLFSRNPPTKRPSYVANIPLKLTVFHVIAAVGLPACQYDRTVVTDILEFLLDRFPDPAIVNATNMVGLTALHLAVSCNNITVVKALLQFSGIDLYAKTRNDRKTAYEYAVHNIIDGVDSAVTTRGQIFVDRYKAERYEIRNLLARAMGIGGPDCIDGMEIENFPLNDGTGRRGHMILAQVRGAGSSS
ncbi:hypothetical protein BDZ91DRAFT_798421 [Kalaharituber pfeilii]|nr:hypothetical protein BDZ91DRAFT_798421 [Kalaharituber pfeilii]